jgi:DNA polymerase-3 subunit delta
LLKSINRSGRSPFTSVELHGDAIAADPGLLADEVNALGLFGDKRIVLVVAGSKNFTSAVESVSQDPPDGCVLVVESGVLRREAPIRSLFEKSRNLVAVECYPDTVSDLERIVRQEAQSNGTSLSSEVLGAITSLLGGDRAATRSELEKLFLYTHGQSEVRIEDVELAIADASTIAMDTALNGAFLGKRDEVTDTAARAFESGVDAAVLMGFGLRHALVLHKARLQVNGGSSVEHVLSSVVRGRPLAYRQSFQRQLNVWSHTRLLSGIDILTEGIRRSRREPRMAEIFAVRALWTVAQFATRRD